LLHNYQTTWSLSA